MRWILNFVQLVTHKCHLYLAVSKCVFANKSSIYLHSTMIMTDVVVVFLANKHLGIWPIFWVFFVAIYFNKWQGGKNK